MVENIYFWLYSIFADIIERFAQDEMSYLTLQRPILTCQARAVRFSNNTILFNHTQLSISHKCHCQKKVTEIIFYGRKSRLTLSKRLGSKKSVRDAIREQHSRH